MEQYRLLLSGKRRVSPKEYLEMVERNEIPAGMKATFLIPGIDTDKPFGEVELEPNARFRTNFRLRYR